MSGARPYPKILRTTEAADATLRAYARKAHLAPFEALILAIGLLRTKDEREAASERAYKFASLWHNLARKLWHRWRSGLWAIAREQNAADGLRREVASAREATRRADAEVERLAAEATVRAREYAAAAAKLGAETERLTRALATATEAARVANVDRARAEDVAKSAKRTADKLRLEVERVTEERDVAVTSRAVLADELASATEREQRGITRDVDWQEASGAASPEELTTALETHRARRAEAAPCACALPDDFEAKLAERAPGWKGTLPELRARVIKLGFQRYDALATDAAKRAAAKGA